MTIPGHRRWVLWRLAGTLRRSDPHLAAMLAIFTRLTAGEAIASREQAGLAVWIGHRLGWLGRVVTAVGACVSGCARRIMRCAGYICTVVRSRSGGSARGCGAEPR